MRVKHRNVNRHHVPVVEAIHSVTQGTRHVKSETGISVVSKVGLLAAK